MDKIFFEDQVNLGLDLLKITNDDNLLNDDYDNYHRLISDEELYLEPFLIAHYCLMDLNQYSTDQILLGYFDNKEQVENVRVLTDDNGIIYIPRVGYFLTNIPNTQLLLSGNNAKYFLKSIESGKTIDFTFDELMFVGNSSMEIIKYNHSYISQKIKTDPQLDTLNIKEVNLEKITKYSNVLNEGYELIKTVDAVQYNEIEKLVKKIVFFDCGYFMNFSAMDFQGVVFISTYNAAKPLTFIDTLIHETAHLSLNLILLNYQEYFTIDDPFEEKFNSPFFSKDVKRGLYNSIHATFVLAKLVRFYNKLYDADIFTGIRKYELLGLFLLDIKMLKNAISYIDDESLYTQKGMTLLNEIKNVYETVSNEKSSLIKQYKLPKGYGDQNAAVIPRFFEADDFMKANNLSPEVIV